MIGYVTLGSNDIAKARAFYDALFGSIGAKRLMEFGPSFTMYGTAWGKPAVAITIAEDAAGEKLSFSLSDQAREGDHIWWVSDVRKFQNDYPAWSYEYDLETTIREMVEVAREKYVEETERVMVAA